MSVAVVGEFRRVERLGRADVADRLLVSILDHTPQNAFRARLAVLRIPRVPAVGRFAGESTDIFTARTECDSAGRQSMEAEFLASFAEVQFRDALSLTIGILLSPEDAEI